MRQARSIGLSFLFVCVLGGSASAQIALAPLGQYASGGVAEIAAYDPGSRRVFSVNTAAKAIDVIDITNAAAPALLFSIDVAASGTPNSVAAREGVIAVAVENPVKTDPGRVLFFDIDGHPLSAVTVGALPDMVVFTPNGRKVLVANEGEPDGSYSIDPEGSVSIIDLSGGAAHVTQSDVTTARFTNFTPAEIDPSIRIFGPGASVAQDLEPEYIAVSHDSRTAWVTLQENNALAVLDVNVGVFTALKALGFKDHRAAGSGLDASDRDGAIRIANWPVFGMYLPDEIAAFRVRGETYLITANEGDSRDFPAFTEEARVGGVALDPIVFPNATTLKQNANLGRLKITNTRGDTDGDGDFDELYAFGARSFSVWTAGGELLFDSGDQFERITAAAPPPVVFNDSGEGAFDTRSDDKGPEPEGVVVGKAFGRQYAFITLERVGGVMVYDVSNPREPRFVQYINTRATGDRAPEGVMFIKAEDSPTGLPLLVVSYEVSGTTRIFEIGKVQ
jgi:hypothetical protein